jgi:mannan endo-1,4-beta-mannosidase
MNIRNLLLVLVAVLLWMGCGKKNTEPGEPPVFVRSIPENAAENVTLSTDLVVTFDEVVKLASNHNITINGNVADVKALLTQLTINIQLHENTEYVVKIPAGAVINSMGIANDKEVIFKFKTILPEVVEIESNLAVADASPQATKLYTFLKDNYGSKIISSTMASVNWNINEAEWVKQHTGKYPAMATFDYIHLPASPANWIDYSNTTIIEDWWNHNGIISANWHWIVPKKQGDTDSNNFTYKPDETTFSASNALVDGTWENTILKADLEKLAGYLKLLKNKNIPVVWRPFHEAAGNIYEYSNGTAWFWWGAKGAETYKKLWIYMFNYFESQGLNNLIWVWTSQTKDNAFYPGDEFVDIIGRDIYNNTVAASLAAEFVAVQEAYPTKIVTLSECGNVANISAQWSAGATWSFFMPWYDYQRTLTPGSLTFAGTDHEHANASWWMDAMGRDYVLTRDQMPSLK